MPYPSQLPPPIRSGYTGTYLSPQKRTKMDDGSTRTRRKLISNGKIFNFTWSLSEYQKDIWKGWFKFEHVNGQNWVEAPGLSGGPPILIKSMDGNPTITTDGTSRWTITGRFRQRMPPFAPGPNTGLPAWPVGLPETEAEGYTITQVDPATVSDISRYAAPQLRKRFESINTELAVKLILEPAQKDIFDNFYYNTLIGGECWFTMRVPGSMDNSPTRVKVVGEPAEQTLGGIYQVTFKVETSQMKTISRDAYFLIVGETDYAADYFAEDYN